MNAALKTLKKTTALFCALCALSATAVELNVQTGDFVQGVFIADGTDGSDLYADLPDGSRRRLAHNVVGQQDFMFVAPTNGTVRFRATDGANDKADGQFRVRIEHRIPVSRQIAPREDYLSPAVRDLAAKLSAKPADSAQLTEGLRRRIARTGAPLIEPSPTPHHKLVTFLWFGARHNVILWGGPTADHTPLARLPHSDMWFATFDIPDDSFLSYGFAPDVPALPLDKTAQRRALLATLQRDPLNPHTYPPQSAVENSDKFNLRSVLQLRHAPQSPYLQTQNVPHGSLQAHSFHSELLGNSRRMTIYTPPHFDPTQDVNLLFFFDGADYLEKIPTPTILDNMQAAGKLAPTVAVFIDNPSYQTRAAELPPNPVFADMLAQELFPWVAKRLGINPPPKRTALIGSSYGGLAAAYVATVYPQRFGNVLAMSGSFWWKQPDAPSEQNNYLTHRLATMQETLPLKFFISAGRFETVGNEDSILAASRQLKDVLAAKGYKTTYREYDSGHDYFAWQMILSDALYDLLTAQ